MAPHYINGGVGGFHTSKSTGTVVAKKGNNRAGAGSGGITTKLALNIATVTHVGEELLPGGDVGAADGAR